MSGIYRLKGLEVSDMLDVIHVLFEEDAIPLWESHVEAKDRVRETIYRQLYDKKYLYSNTTTSAANALGFDPDMELPEASPQQKREIKPYIPPTDPEDLMRVLAEPPLR